MNNIKTIALLIAGFAALQSPGFAADAARPAQAAKGKPVAAKTAPAPSQAPVTQNAGGVLDQIVAVVNKDVITENELQDRVHSVALNFRPWSSCVNRCSSA